MKAGIWFGCVSVQWGNRQHNYFFSMIAESEIDAKKRALKACRKEYPASRWTMVNRVAYRVEDDMIHDVLKQSGLCTALDPERPGGPHDSARTG